MSGVAHRGLIIRVHCVVSGSIGKLCSYSETGPTRVRVFMSISVYLGGCLCVCVCVCVCVYVCVCPSVGRNSEQLKYIVLREKRFEGGRNLQQKLYLSLNRPMNLGNL